MESKVIKAKGKFQIVPSSAEVARSMAKADRRKSTDKLSDADLVGIIQRILDRLDALEAG